MVQLSFIFAANFSIFIIYFTQALITNISPITTNNFAQVSKNLILNGVESPSRKFYVRVWTKGRSCGGAIIGRNWVITATDCVSSVSTRGLSVEFGDFACTRRSKGNNGRKSSRISQIFLTKSLTPKYANVALLKTRRNLYANGTCHGIELCDDRSNDDVVLTTCGMGWNATSEDSSMGQKHTYPEYLKEMHYSRLFGEDVSQGIIHSHPVLAHSSICVGDLGNPLYVLGCASREPECLFGVAIRWNWTTTKDGFGTCSQPNEFTMLEPLRDRVYSIIENN